MNNNKYQVNLNSILMTSILNLVFILPIFVFFYLVDSICKNINDLVLLYSSLLSIIFIEFWHRFFISNENIAYFFYRLKSKLESFFKEKIYITLEKLFMLFNVIFIIFTLVYVFFLKGSIHIKSENISDLITNIVSISSFILTFVLALLQHFSNKFIDFNDLLSKWKTNVIILLMILVSYFIVGFLTVYFKKMYFCDYWLYIASIFLVIQLFLAGSMAIILMNDNGIIQAKTTYVLERLKKFPSLYTSNDALNFIKQRKDKLQILKKFFTYQVIGIIPNKIKNYQIYFDSYIKQDTEALFRVAKQYIEQDNFVLFNRTINCIDKIITQLIIIGKDVEHFGVFEYFAKKQNELLKTLIEQDKEDYFPTLKDLYVNTTKQLILNSTIKGKNLLHSTIIRYYIDQLKDIVLLTARFMHTTVPITTVEDLKEIAVYLINKDDYINLLSIIKYLQKTTTIIARTIKLPNSNIDKIFASTIINHSLYALINIMFQIIMKSFAKKPYTHDNIIRDIKAAYISIFKDASENILLTNCPSSSLHTYPSTHYSMYYNCVANNPNIKTPYTNLVLNGAMSQIDNIASLTELFGYVFITDLHKDKSFVSTILQLNTILDILPDLELNNISCSASDNFLDFCKSVMKSAFLFKKRINYFKFKLEENTELINSFLIKLIEISFIQFKKLYKNSNDYDFISNYILYLVEFLYFNNQSEYRNSDIQQVLFEKFDRIIELFDEEDDEQIKEDLFTNLNLACIRLFELAKESKLFEKLIYFVKNNEDDFIKKSWHNSMWKNEGLPSNAEYIISEHTLLEYISYKQQLKKQ